MIYSQPTGSRNGFTTGACAAAASQAALRLLNGESPLNTVCLDLPGGEILSVPIHRVWREGDKASAEVIKDAGDDPDITHGCAIIAEIELNADAMVMITGGAGVGRVTKPGLAVAVGEAAINPGPLAMIRSALNSHVRDGQGVRVVISVPEGERLAVHTMNPRLGIVGGISILGTSGMVRPMSLELWADSLLPQLAQAKALGF